MLKAYVVYETEEEDEQMVVVFADSPAHAKQQALGDSDVEWTLLRTRREPAFDQYAESGTIPERDYLENGWWWTCVGDSCSEHVDIGSVGGERENGELVCAKCAMKEGLVRPDWAPLDPEGAGE